MKYIAIFLTVIVIMTALFGFTSMKNDPSHMGFLNENCPIAKLLNFSCTPDIGAMVLQHISVSQSFFSIPLISFLALILTLIVFGLIGSVWVLLGSLVANLKVAQSFKLNFYRHIKFFATRKFLSWFSLLENSPSRI